MRQAEHIITEKQKIFYAVLNWGIGHATRSAVYIDRLLSQGHKVIIASDGIALSWLAKRFPQCEVVALPSYGITYPKKQRSWAWHMLKQSPKIMRRIREEHRKTEEYVSHFNVSKVVSDSRYGAYSKKVNSAIISNQLYLHVNDGLLEKAINLFYRSYIMPFDTWIVPDSQPPQNLSGKLSQAKGRPKEFIGTLSRLNIEESTPKTIDICVLLSGPEPQRMHLETTLYKALKNTDYRVQFICGSNPDSTSKSTDKMIVSGFVDDDFLNKTLGRSSIILCRSGYSTLMDIDNLKACKLLIPTPGQTEQEYLAKRCVENNERTFALAQHEISSKLHPLLKRLLRLS